MTSPSRTRWYVDDAAKTKKNVLRVTSSTSWNKMMIAMMLFMIPYASALITCPRPINGTLGTLMGSEILSLQPERTVTIANTIQTNELCTLVHVILKENEIVSMIPVGRSYSGRSWHRVAGPYKTKLTFDCTDMTSSCKVTLPPFVTDTTTSSTTGEEEPTTTETHSYVLISYKHSITKEEDISRFLEQTTFGPTKSDIIELQNTTYANWIHDQMYTKEMTLHRAHYRKRSNARSTYTGKFLSSKGNNNDITNYGSSQDIGISKLPCDNESRWRNYAFTVEEAATRWNAFTVKVSDTDPQNYFAIVDVFGNQRTEVPVGWPGFDIGSFFYLCYQDRYVMEEWIGGYLRISPSFTNSCYNVPGGNPKIQFHSMSTPEHVVNFSPSSITLIPMTTDYKQQRIGINNTNVTFVNRNWEHSNFLLTNGPVTSEDDVCQLDVKYWNDGTKLAHGVMDFGSTKEWYIHDPHLILQSNDISNPLPDGGGSNKYIGSDTWCSNAPRTFLNEQTCRMSLDASACQATEGYSFDLRDVTLDEATLQDFYKRTGRLIYALNMTEPDTTPCDVSTSKKSRWMKRHDLSSSQSICESSNSVSTTTPTITTIKTKLATSPVGLNHLPVVDIQMGTNDPCDAATPKKLRLFVTNNVDPNKKHCWEHVHFDEMNIYDFTDWSIEHGTSQYSSRSDAISQFAERGESYLVFPFWKNPFHTQDRWLAKKDEWMGLPIGLLNSTLAFDNLPTKLKTNSVLQKYIIQTTDDGGSSATESGGVGTIVCGSPGEIGNDPTLGDEYDMLMDERWDDRTWGSDFSAQKHSVWTDIVLSESNDQLRQRMAWSLSQLIPMVPGDITKRHKTEPYLAFYDIFVRHAFGNYFDILKEISYHPMMAAMLTFLESKSRGYVSKTQGITGAFPDENFAREIMQLFSIGLVQLNMDGTPIYYNTDDEETVKQTYTNLDIMDNARAWTGFERQGYERGNIEHFRHPDAYHNLIDLMKLRREWRDVFPKASIYDEGYIGDGYVPCVDLLQETHSYLRKGATYRLLGSRPVPTLQHDPKEWEFDSNTEHLTLSHTGTSELYSVLCQADTEGVCDFQSVVTLETHLTCDETTNECYVDQPRVIKMGGHSDPDIYYEYVAPSCVQFPFYSSPLKIITRGDSSTTTSTVEAMCANPKLPHASEACCDIPTGSTYVENAKRSHCMFSGERVTYESSIERCSLANLQPCSIYNKLLFEPTINNNEANCIRSNINPPSSEGGNCCLTDTQYHWTNEPCNIQIVINENGEIAIRHEHNDVDVRTGNIRGQIAPDVGDTSVNFFRVYWRHGSYPSVADGTCGTGSTSEDDDDEECYMELTNCVCHVSIKNQQVFQDIPTKEQALKLLRIGSVSPDWYDVGDCIELGVENGIKAWDCSGEGEEFTEDTIFEIMEPPSPRSTGGATTFPYNPNEPLFLKNMFSSVTMYRGTYQFRNPPHFMTLNEPSVRDAQHETDAVLQQLFYHPNTAPFVSHRLIQRFGISNPSPEYIESVSQAFVSGLYTHEGVEFGSTGYGDLAATCAAIILHPESRNAVVDSDPFHGSLREPFLKVIHFMRSMEIQPQIDLGYKHVRLSDITSKIGQFVHAIPNVFSFFLSDNIPSGRLNVASLSSPEVGVANTPTIMGLLGGLFSLIKYGLTGCYGGFGSSSIGECGIGTAQITYEPSTNAISSGPGSALRDAIDEMSLLLTGGRLNDKPTKELIHTVSQKGGGYNYYDQIRIAQQLIVSTPEFHSNGGVIHRQLDAPRNESPTPTYSGKEYKAIVFFFMKDGMDSYNMLVPDDTECSDMFQMYQTTRGSVALDTSELLPPFSAGGTQPTCDKYRFHHQLSTVHQLYNEGDVMLFANMGVSLEDNINKENWEQTHYQTKLFAHDVQQKETMTVDPFQQVSGTGVLGRITDALNTPDPNNSEEPLFHTGASSLVGKQFALYNREDGVSSPLITYLSEDGVTKFDPLPSTPDMFSTIQTLNGPTTYNSHAFGDLWSQSASQALLENEYLFNLLDGATLDNGSFPSTTALSNKMSMIAKLIKLHESRGIDRDVFFVNQGGWDVHSDAKSRTSALFETMDHALRDFSNEMKAQGHWNNTVVVMLSEFGRTLTPNTGGGTDHGWGGNYFIAGGNVKGSQMKGIYPENYDDYDVSRARLHPTLPNEAMWNGISEWFDVPLDQLDEVLPNRYKFVDSNKLFSKTDMFN